MRVTQLRWMKVAVDWYRAILRKESCSGV